MVSRGDTTAPTAQLPFEGLGDQTSKLEKALAEAERLLAQSGGTGPEAEGQHPRADKGGGKSGRKGQGSAGVPKGQSEGAAGTGLERRSCSG